MTTVNEFIANPKTSMALFTVRCSKPGDKTWLHPGVHQPVNN